MSFTRLLEDFTCSECQTLVHGNGYTNHCPNCLCSRHVDLSPGDRASSCHGVMDPIAARPTAGNPGFEILHRCRSCPHTRAQRASKDDNRDLLITLTTKPWPIASS